jgi:hypothetical protein
LNEEKDEKEEQVEKKPINVLMYGWVDPVEKEKKRVKLE